MTAVVGPNWLDQHVLRDIREMLVQDAYFKLMGYARQLTGKFNGGVAGLIYVGYLTSQTVAIRRLCENKRDVISLRRVLEESKKTNTAVGARAGYLAQKLDSCQSIIDLVNNYIAHTGNPQRRPNSTPSTDFVRVPAGRDLWGNRVGSDQPPAERQRLTSFTRISILIIAADS